MLALEIMEVVLDLRAGRDLKSGLHEYALDAQARARDGMNAARLLSATRQRDVDRALGKFRVERGRLERFRGAIRWRLE